MNKKKLHILGVILIPVGAFFLNACGPVEGMDEEFALKESSDKFGFLDRVSLSEYGRCNDAQDNDGDGLTDPHDPDCHRNAGPIRDLSLYNFPQGHNFYPDVSKILPGGPGFPGGFRNGAQIARWLRFLTEPDGNVAGIDIYGYGVNPDVVPTPAILPEKIRQGTAAHGNNNNVSLRSLHHIYLEHGFLPPLGAAAAAAKAPAPNQAAKKAFDVASSTFDPNFYGDGPRGIKGGWPGAFYNGGSQGALKEARTGNPDGKGAHDAPVPEVVPQ